MPVGHSRYHVPAGLASPPTLQRVAPNTLCYSSLSACIGQNIVQTTALVDRMYSNLDRLPFSIQFERKNLVQQSIACLRKKKVSSQASMEKCSCTERWWADSFDLKDQIYKIVHSPSLSMDWISISRCSLSRRYCERILVGNTMR